MNDKAALLRELLDKTLLALGDTRSTALGRVTMPGFAYAHTVRGVYAVREAVEEVLGEREALRDALIGALAHLPDSLNGDDWDWCWDELSSDSQETVKKIRAKGNAALASTEGAERAAHGP